MPDKYRRVKFGDVVRQVKNVVDPETAGLDRYVAGEHMDTDDLRIRRWGEVGSGYLGPAFHIRFKPGQVLYGSRRTYLRKVAVPHFEGICANTTFVLEPKDGSGLLTGFLPFLMQTDEFTSYSMKNSKGSVNPYINFSDLACFQFVLPPQNRQEEMVSALSSIDECTEAVIGARGSASVLFKSMLNLMWEDYPKVTIAKLVEEGIIDSPQDGNHGEKHPKARDYLVEGIPFVMASDLKSGRVDFTSCKRIAGEQAQRLRIGFARPGDVLLSHKGTVGEVAWLDEAPTDYVMLTPQVTYYRVLDQCRLTPMWLYFAFQTPGFQRQLDQYGRQSTRAYVGIMTQRQLTIPFPSISAQRELVTKLLSIQSAISHCVMRQKGTTELRLQSLKNMMQPMG